MGVSWPKMSWLVIAFGVRVQFAFLPVLQDRQAHLRVPAEACTAESSWSHRWMGVPSTASTRSLARRWALRPASHSPGPDNGEEVQLADEGEDPPKMKTGKIRLARGPARMMRKREPTLCLEERALRIRGLGRLVRRVLADHLHVPSPGGNTEIRYSVSPRFTPASLGPNPRETSGHPLPSVWPRGSAPTRGRRSGRPGPPPPQG